jgi:hypothetical protein
MSQCKYCGGEIMKRVTVVTHDRCLKNYLAAMSNRAKSLKRDKKN